MENEQITLSVGRDYRSTTKYEYVVFKGEEVLVRAGFFASFMSFPPVWAGAA